MITLLIVAGLGLLTVAVVAALTTYAIFKLSYGMTAVETYKWLFKDELRGVGTGGRR